LSSVDILFSLRSAANDLRHNTAALRAECSALISEIGSVPASFQALSALKLMTK
jgi:hypothetical protein